MIRGNKTDEAFPDGVVTIYDVSDGGNPGGMPVLILTEKVALRYRERTVGIKRFEQAMQNNAKVDMVLRCPRRRDVSSQDGAIIARGSQLFRIRQVQYPEGTTPPVMDLSLVREDQIFEFA